MRRLMIISTIPFIFIFLLASCRTIEPTLEDEENHVETPVEHEIYHETIRNFEEAVEVNDPEALYDLVDLNYIGEVYWTEKEAADLIAFFQEEPARLHRQVYLLEESINDVASVSDTYQDTSENIEKRIPFASSKEGFFFLQEDGNLSIKLWKHMVSVQSALPEDFESFVIQYKDTGLAFSFDPASIQDSITLNHQNEKVVGLIYFGPGNYEVHFTLEEKGEVKKVVEDVKLRETDMFISLTHKNEKLIYYTFK